MLLAEGGNRQRVHVSRGEGTGISEGSAVNRGFGFCKEVPLFPILAQLNYIFISTTIASRGLELVQV